MVVEVSVHSPVDRTTIIHPSSPMILTAFRWSAVVGREGKIGSDHSAPSGGGGFEDDANYNSDESLFQSTMNDSVDKVTNENNGIEDEVPNDSGDENDGLSDVNEDDIIEEEVVDNHIIGMDEIKQTSLEAYAYLSKISLEIWAVHAFDVVCKTDHNTNKVVEAFNGWMNKHRILPMLTMMERAASRSIAPTRPRKPKKRMTNEAGSSSTPGGPNSTHLGHALTHTGNATAIDLGGSSTTAATPRILGTVTRVLWFPSTHEGTLTRRDATNYVSTQSPTQFAPQPSQESQP
ncbi:hypothetical protein EZV62_024709 [Acer yangbiense]|uniref:Uncharacterized protein n=1 Tax=Acer yangbiense TaxID=1000413 RepID=A0A5C7GVK8_9ROSI|nr:hypothetical protein EZV62_024709 [Acer yangbiense]